MVIEFKQLNEQQQGAIDGYSKGAHNPINRDLRENKFPLWWDALLTEHTTRIIDYIFFSVPAKKTSPDIVYRGTCNDIIYDSPEFKVNQFMSTSLKEEVAGKFITPDNGILLKIHLQDTNINLLEIEREENSSQEFEYLIPRNTKFRVLYREISTIHNQQIPCIGICPF
jgi:hypothetical protein